MSLSIAAFAAATTTKLAAVNILGGINQLVAIVSAGIVLIAGVKAAGHLMRNSYIGVAAVAILAGAIYMMIGTSFLHDMGDTIHGWLK